MEKVTNLALLGCGTIGRYVLDSIVEAKKCQANVAVVCVRSECSKGVDHVRKLNVPLITDPLKILDYGVGIVVESASHEAVEQYGELFLRSGVSFIPMSLGAFVDSDLLERLIRAAQEGNAKLIIPSGGVGGLDAVRAAMIAGLDTVSITIRKPPKAWEKIPYVEEMKWDMSQIHQPTVLYEGSARDCVRKFPQNVNIAAALSLASLGFDKTQVRILADPTVTLNTHLITCSGPNGKLSFQFENTPVEENPKTTYQACASVVATIQRHISAYQVGS